jgi:hypothetical protein
MMSWICLLVVLYECKRRLQRLFVYRGIHSVLYRVLQEGFEDYMFESLILTCKTCTSH